MTEARLPRTGTIAFGGDYNPEQWPPEVWDADYAAFDAARITTVTLGVFLWSVSQPGPDRYDFTVLDRIVQRAEDEGRRSAWPPAPGHCRRGWRTTTRR